MIQEERNPLAVLKWLAHYFHKHGHCEKARDIYDQIARPLKGGARDQLERMEVASEDDSQRVEVLPRVK